MSILVILHDSSFLPGLILLRSFLLSPLTRVYKYLRIIGALSGVLGTPTFLLLLLKLSGPVILSDCLLHLINDINKSGLIIIIKAISALLHIRNEVISILTDLLNSGTLRCKNVLPL